MNGMGIMLKSMGIDPEMLTNIGKELGEKLVSFDNRLTRIEDTLQRIERLLEDGVSLPDRNPTQRQLLLNEPTHLGS